MADLNQRLWAISSLDGRYGEHFGDLAPHVSEAALITYRVKVEAAWLLHLAEIPALATILKLKPEIKTLLTKYATEDLTPALLKEVKKFEETTNHDVKAVEYFLRKKLTEAKADNMVLSFLHFACTSEDINNLAYALMLNEVRNGLLLRQMDYILQELAIKADEYAALPMIARTHGQTASPTTLGKELAVFGHRLRKQRNIFAAVKLEAKVNGAVGNYNAHMAAFPKIDWPKVTKDFIEKRFGLSQNVLTTQIENHDSMIEYLDALRRFNTILLGFCRDTWSYISLGYFKQFMNKDEVGSSTMPHKVNPIDFENAEGNLGVAIAISQHLSEKLPISRWQRDLSDSTVLRVLGSLFGHSLLSYSSCQKGLAKISANKPRIAADTEPAWEVLAEAIQTVMRRYGVADAYERLKDISRGREVTKEMFFEIIEKCDELPAAAKADLKKLTPTSYTGIAEKLARGYSEHYRDAISEKDD